MSKHPVKTKSVKQQLTTKWQLLFGFGQKKRTSSKRRTSAKKKYYADKMARILIVIGLLGISFFGLHLTKPVSLTVQTVYAPPTPSPVLDYTAPTVKPRSEPINIRIPKIGIDTKIIIVGRLTDGSMETPDVLDNVTGWYKYSPTPGELGPAIIVGHVDSYKGISVFWRLRELQPGDIIEIDRADKSIVKFKIDFLKQFDQANFPTQEVYGDIDYAGLRLVTCGGTFNSQTGHYTANTVVFATLVDGT